MHCKYFEGRFYRFSLSMWKKPILHYQQFMEKPYVTFLKIYSYHISAIKIFAVCASKLWTNSEPQKHIDYWPFSGSGKQTYIHVFFSAWKKLHDMAATFWPLYQLSMRILDSIKTRVLHGFVVRLYHQMLKYNLFKQTYHHLELSLAHMRET